MVSKKSYESKAAKTYTYLAVLIIVVMIAAVFVYTYRYPGQQVTTDQSELKRFANYNELKSYVQDHQENYGGYGFGVVGGAMRTMEQSAMPVSAPSDFSANVEKSSDYSTTNIQVEGVDEPDFVKNDGKYIYTITGNKIVIADAYPATNAKILSTIESDQPQELFINGNKLVVFGYVNQVAYEGSDIPEKVREIMPDYYPYRYTQEVFVRTYDVSDHANPVLVRNFTIEGSYVDARMIGDYAYVIVTAPVVYDNGEVIMPRIADAEISPSVYYFDTPVNSFSFTNIVSVNVRDDTQPINSKTFMLGYTNALYVSQENIYISYRKTPDPLYILEKMVNGIIVPVVPQPLADELKNILASGATYNEKTQQLYEKFSAWYNKLSEDEKRSAEQQFEENSKNIQNEISREYEKTVIHKISVNNGEIEYMKAGEIFGDILNQFSMDEYNGNFRAATTTHGYYSGESVTKNHIFVLDADMNIIGSLEDLAPGETIYSARFIGDRVYLVTFKKIDPLFVIDLSDPTKPAVLGRLKIPGYSDYLHPYDENHIIGIGKETVESETGNFAWYQGIKLSLFDVTDVANPVELTKFNIGDRGTDSYALNDHKAFLFSKSKNLLVIPILLAEINESQYPDGVTDFAYGNPVWGGGRIRL